MQIKEDIRACICLMRCSLCVCISGSPTRWHDEVSQIQDSRQCRVFAFKWQAIVSYLSLRPIFTTFWKWLRNIELLWKYKEHQFVFWPHCFLFASHVCMCFFERDVFCCVWWSTFDDKACYGWFSTDANQRTYKDVAMCFALLPVRLYLWIPSTVPWWCISNSGFAKM